MQTDSKKTNQAQGISGSPYLRLTVGAMLTIACGTQALGDGFRNPPESAAGIGTVGARYTLVRDASAMAFNPANLTAVDTKAVQASATYVHSQAEFTSLMGTAKTRDNSHWLPNLFMAAPLKTGDTVVGLAVTTPFGQSTTWDKDSVFRYTAPYFAEVRVFNFNPTLAMRLSDDFSIGIGADAFYSDLDFRQVGPWSMLTLNPMDPDGELRMDADGWGFGANIGLAWRIHDRHTLAASYRSAVEVDYDGDLRISNIPDPLSMMVAPTSDLDTDISFPAVAAIGYSMAVNDSFRFGIDVEWIEFSRFDRLDIDAGVNAPLIQQLGLSSVQEKWDDTWTAGVGSQWDMQPNWTLLSGYIFMESPIPEETFSPTLPNGDQHAVTLGLRRHTERAAVTLSYAYVHNEDREIRNNQNPAYNGDYDIDPSQILGLSYACLF